MAKHSSKINKIRTFALSLVFIGFLVMYLGLIFENTSYYHDIFMGLGLLFIIASTGVYFWIGMLSTKTCRFSVLSCNKPTKILGV